MRTFHEAEEAEEEGNPRETGRLEHGRLGQAATEPPVRAQVWTQVQAQPDALLGVRQAMMGVVVAALVEARGNPSSLSSSRRGHGPF